MMESKFGGMIPPRQRPRADLSRRLNGTAEVSDSGGVGLRDQQRGAVLGIAHAALRLTGLVEADIGQAETLRRSNISVHRCYT